MPIKDRIGLCKMVMYKEPTQQQANMVFLQLEGIKAKNKMSRLKSRVSEITNSVSTKPIEKQGSAVQKMSPSNNAAQPLKRLPAVQAAIAPALPAWVCGAAEWKKYIGDPGVEPPLPPDIIQRLGELNANNVLVLIPETVNGRPLDLKLMEELVQKPLQGHATKYRYFDLGEYVDPPASKSHWALLTRTVIDGSRNKRYEEKSYP